MSDLAPIWLDAPCPALDLWHDAGQTRWRLNRAAHRMVVAGAAVAKPTGMAGAALAGPASRRRPKPAAAVGSLSLRLPRAWPLPPGWLLWLRRGPCRRRPAATARQEAADKLALMQGFDRIGFVERDARTGRGWWDKHMFRMVGLEPALQPPSFEEALRCVHPDDRDDLLRAPPPGHAAGRAVRDRVIGCCCRTAGSATCRR